MALFSGGSNKKAGLPQLLRKVQAHEYTTSTELDATLAEIAAHDELSARAILFMLSDSNPKVREFAAPRVFDLAGANLIQLLVDAMRGIEPRARREIAKLAVRAELRQLFDALALLMYSKQVDERTIALEIVGEHPKWFEFISFLKSGLKDGEAQIRRRATRILRRGMKNPTVRLILLELVHDDDDAVRREAITGLAQVPATDIVEPFFTRLPDEPRETQKFMVDALAQLATHPEAKLEERLIPILASEDESLREIAVSLLASMPNRTAVLRAYLVHSRGLATWLRERTHQSILRMSDDILDPLIELMQDPEDDVRVGAMVMLKGTSNPRIIPVVHSIFVGDSDWWIRSIACDVLAQFHTPEVVDALLEKIDDPDMRYGILTVLGKLLDHRTAAVLLDSLTDPSRGIRNVVLESLRGASEVFGNDPIVEQIADRVLWHAKNDLERSVQEKAADVLTAFGVLAGPRLRDLADHEAAVAAEVASFITSELSMENADLNETPS